MTRSWWVLAALAGCTDKGDADTDTTAAEPAVDSDGDGSPDDTDCDAQDASVHPGAEEVCDGIDNDCDNATDEGVTLTFYADGDGDGYGNPTSAREGCTAPAGHVEDNTDCDDSTSQRAPGNAEVCDGIDNNCDHTVDEGVLSTFYADDDLDGYGNEDDTAEGCTAPPGYTSVGGDCDDTRDDAYPGGTELCDGADNDCDPKTTEDGRVTWLSGTGAVDRTADFAAGTRANPAAISLSSPGTLSMCGGTWFATIAISDDVDIVGVGGAAANILDGGGARSVVSMEVEKHSASLTGATLQSGAGTCTDPLGFGGGGGLCCVGNTSTLDLSDVIIQDSSAGVGGGLMIWGCTMSAEDLSILGNDASYGGGGLAMFSGVLALDGGLISDNEATTLGGGVHVQGYRFAWAFLDLDDTLVTRNHASYGSGLSQYNTSAVTCTGSEKTTYGFTRNSRSPGNAYTSAVFISTMTSTDSFTATDCDFGTGSEANAAGDVYNVNDGAHYSGYGPDADFICDDEGCY